jgi:hypothetical protein
MIPREFNTNNIPSEQYQPTIHTNKSMQEFSPTQQLVLMIVPMTVAPMSCVASATIMFMILRSEKKLKASSTVQCTLQ